MHLKVHMLELVWLLVPGLAMKYYHLLRYITSCELSLRPTFVKYARASNEVLLSAHARAVMLFFSFSFYKGCFPILVYLPFFFLLVSFAAFFPRPFYLSSPLLMTML